MKRSACGLPVAVKLGNALKVLDERWWSYLFFHAEGCRHCQDTLPKTNILVRMLLKRDFPEFPHARARNLVERYWAKDKVN